MFEKEAKEYVETKGKEHFREFYDKELSMADLLKECCVEFATEATKEFEKQLAEAKAIIREYVNWDYGDHTNCLPDITKKAEAFLKE